MGDRGVLEVLGEASETGLVVGVGEGEELRASVAPDGDALKVVEVFLVGDG
jgi:hypothetical protein